MLSAEQKPFSDEALGNIDSDGYYILGVYDDEYFVAGVLQFYVGYSQSSGSYGLINYIFINEDFSFRDIDAVNICSLYYYYGI